MDFTGEHRLASYIIHYAGYPYQSGLKSVIEQDIKTWTKGRNYKRHIHILVSGGLGDQIDAEPSIRFAKKLFAGDKMIVSTHFPVLFRHLEDEQLQVFKVGQIEFAQDTPYWTVQSFPNTKSIQWSVLSNLMSHTVDFISMCIMKRTLPLEDREIKLTYTEQEKQSMREKVGLSEEELKSYTLIHPGKHWSSKTFPVEYWQEIVDNTDKAIIIGQTSAGDPPTFVAGARGTVDVVAGKAIDMRDKLKLTELFALIAIAKTVVSNDSAPIHIAGAFDNNIVLIPSCKHPDHIMPYRKKQQYYKGYALFKALTIDDCESRPYVLNETTAEFCKREWSEYLPEPKEVYNLINSL
jgi:hypothetical protein